MAALPRQSHRRRDWFSKIGQKMATKSILSPTSSKLIEIDWIRLQRFSNSGFRERDNQSAARCWTDPSRRAGRTTSRAAQTLQVLNSWEILWGRFCLWIRADLYKQTIGLFLHLCCNRSRASYSPLFVFEISDSCQLHWNTYECFGLTFGLLVPGQLTAHLGAQTLFHTLCESVAGEEYWDDNFRRQ